MIDRAQCKALILAAVLCGGGMAAGAEEPRSSGVCPAGVTLAAGIDTLGEALDELGRQGLRILYTSRLVDIDARIGGLPCTGSPEERLGALLTPLGLAAHPEGDQLVIGRAAHGGLEGTVRAEPGGQAIARARIRLLPEGPNNVSGGALSDADGHFHLPRVPTGSQAVEISRPGFVPRRWQVRIDDGQRHRLDATLRLDAEASDEILVSTTLEEPPLGTWQPSREQLLDDLALDQDALAAASRLPGTQEGQGVAFGVRGHEAERLTLVVDGIEIAEPYHFRHLGSFAGAVTPSAIDDLRLHRGSPPVVYGDRAGGVLEVLTETPGNTGRFLSTRFGVGDEATQARLGGRAPGDRLRWLAAYRQGEPEPPPAGADLDQRPGYWDGLAKLSLSLDPHHELTLQTLRVADDLSVLFRNPFVRALTIDQDSRYSQLRWLGTLGERHGVDARLSKSELERRRFGQEQLADILTPPETNQDFVLDDRRRTRRTVGHVDGVSSLADGLEGRWGAEFSRETTTYDYLLFAPFREPRGVLVIPTTFYVDELEQERTGLYSQATWRPRADLTLSGGLRFDDADLARDPAWVPRLGASFRIGPGAWRFAWARVRDSPDTHELPLADEEERLPGTERSDYVSLGCHLVRGRHGLSIEVYHQRIVNPRLRFENLFQSVSRVPELELDRHRAEAEASRNQGLEVRYDYRVAGLRGSATYELGRFEDRLADGSWQPRRSDRRHALHLSLAAQLPFGIDADLLWRGASGRRTTPLDLELAWRDFEAALGEINSRRLPTFHRLDLRLSRVFEVRGITLRAGVGVDNLYDRRNVTGLDLLPLRDPTGPLSELPVEHGLGRTLRWSFALSF